jgi:hypothetical protein
MSQARFRCWQAQQVRLQKRPSSLLRSFVESGDSGKVECRDQKKSKTQEQHRKSKRVTMVSMSVL